LIGGLYLANLELGISLRLYNMPSLNPRGIPEHYPVWSPDSSQFAIALPTDYDVELFVVSADGSVSRNVTQHGAFDFWPTWSPDGSRLAFVSDRNECQTWVPAEPGSCSQIEPETSEEDLDDLLGGESANTVVPTEGNVFVMDIATESVRQVSELVVDSPPIWVSNLQIGFTTGLSDPLATNTEIWLVNIPTAMRSRIWINSCLHAMVFRLLGLLAGSGWHLGGGIHSVRTGWLLHVIQWSCFLSERRLLRANLVFRRMDSGSVLRGFKRAQGLLMAGWTCIFRNPTATVRGI